MVQGRGPFNLHINEGECVVVSGHSGTGKSLLLRAICDLDVHQGECQLDSLYCHEVPAPEWRRHVGLLPAKPSWWFDTVKEHFIHYDQAAMDALGFTIETWNWQVSRLSSGEQQRLALLRLLQFSPRALLLDEPTASLDKTNTTRVEKLLAQYQAQHQSPILWVTHDPEQARRVGKRHFYLNANGLEIVEE